MLELLWEPPLSPLWRSHLDKSEQEAFYRSTLEKQRLALGRDHRNRLTAAANLAASFEEQGECAEAAKVQSEVIVQETRLLSAEHMAAQITATNLAVSLSQCGQLM